MVRLTEIRHRCPRCSAELAAQTSQNFHCERCNAEYPVIDGIPSLLPRESDLDVKEYFERIAGELRDGKISYAPGNAALFDRQVRVLANAASRALRRWVPEGSLIIDVGCGHGQLLESVVPHYCVVGLDFVPGMLAFARAREHAVYHGDASAIPFMDSQFDAVVCTEMINQYHDMHALLSEFRRICRPNGMVILSTMNRNSLLRKMRGTFQRLLRKHYVVPMVRRSAREIIEASAQYGLELREIEWVLSPTRAVLFSNGVHFADTLASNFFICFRKKP